MFLLLLVLIVFKCHCQSNEITDQLSLLTFKNTLSYYDPLKIITTDNKWSINSLPCGNNNNNNTWSNIFCNINNNRVTKINLQHSSLTGKLASEIGMLDNLKVLIINSNMLTSTIPSDIGNLKQLSILNIYNNKFISNIPSEIGNLNKLVELMIFSNSFTGTLPSQMNNYPKLITFYAQNNYFSGNIPSNWDSFTNLKFMDISNSGLVCSLLTVCKMSLLLYKGLANTLRINTLITSSLGFSVETWSCTTTNNNNIPECDSIVLLPNIVITAIIEPNDKVKPFSTQGLSVQTLNGIALFDSLQFIGQANVDYGILFSQLQV